MILNHLDGFVASLDSWRLTQCPLHMVIVASLGSWRLTQCPLHIVIFCITILADLQQPIRAYSFHDIDAYSEWIPHCISSGTLRASSHCMSQACERKKQELR